MIDALLKRVSVTYELTVTANILLLKYSIRNNVKQNGEICLIKIKHLLDLYCFMASNR